jgi:hypothetical protein
MTSYGRSLKKAVSIKTSQFQVRVCSKKQLNFLFVFKWEKIFKVYSGLECRLFCQIGTSQNKFFNY